MTYVKQTWIDDSSYATAERLNHIEEGIQAAGAATINIAEPPYNAKGDGETDNAAGLKKAVADLPVNGGTLIVPYGIFLCSEELDFHGKHSIIFRGQGGLSAGAACASFIKYTGSGTHFINAQSTYGFILQDIQMIASNEAFKGYLVDLSHDEVLKTDSAYFHLQRCYLEVKSTTEGAGLLLDRAVDGEVSGNHFKGGQYGIVGRLESAHYANAIGITGNNVFRSQGTASIQGPGEAWRIDGNTFEALFGGGAGAIAQVSGGGSSGGCVSNNWFGDVVAGKGGTQIVAGSGQEITSNFIGGSAATTGVSIPAGAIATAVKTNSFNTHEKGIVLSPTAKDCEISPNFYTSVTTKFTEPTIEALTKAGAEATVEIKGSDWSGLIVLKSGKAGRAAGALIKVNLASTHSHVRPTITAFGEKSQSLEAYISAVTETGFTISTLKEPAESTTYEWFFQVSVGQ